MTASEAEVLEGELQLQTDRLRDPLRNVCRYALEGGCRVRAGLLLAAAPGAGAAAVKAAAALEMMHAATLLQDDIFDAGHLRRGRLAAHVRFGKAQAILASDWLLVRSLELAAEAGGAYFQCLARAAKAMTEAEACELNLLAPQSVEDARRVCHDIAKGKTGTLFGAALCGAAQVLGAAHVTCGEWERLGTEMGITYQLVDDCMDSYGDESLAGKTLGHDLSAGCLTVPMLLSAVVAERQGAEVWAALAARRSLGPQEMLALRSAMHSETVRQQLEDMIAARMGTHRSEGRRVGLDAEALRCWIGELDQRTSDCFGRARRDCEPSEESRRVHAQGASFA